MSDKKTYGEVRCLEKGVETTKQVESYVQARFTDNRLISVSKLEDETYVLAVENPESTGRATAVHMRLTEESLIGLVTTIHMHINCDSADSEKMLQEATKGKSVDYSFSDNLKTFKPS